mmetsp:Transcript_4384/g.8524  ORF Transcript_4384/g.8524 Transcript_4384/m.8524 type:complete len:98 (+) Transcript_4384:45-338(+)
MKSLAYLILVAAHAKVGAFSPVSSLVDRHYSSNVNSVNFPPLHYASPDVAASLSAAVVSASTSSAVMLAETDPWVVPLQSVLDPLLNLLSFAMVRAC